MLYIYSVSCQINSVYFIYFLLRKFKMDCNCFHTCLQYFRAVNDITNYPFFNLIWGPLLLGYFLCETARVDLPVGHTEERKAGSMAAADSTVSNGQKTDSLNGEPAIKRSRESAQVESLRIPKEPRNKVTVVLGAQWGDEGKGKVVDLLAMGADIVCRCQVRLCQLSLTSESKK